MAQNDMNIANQGFPAFRADLNNALGALVSNSSGATAPATTFAHQLWVDTSANPSVLKIRNADNDAFITIGTINQTGDTFTLTAAGAFTTLSSSSPASFAAGTNALPSITITGDTNTGVFFPAADTIALTNGGVESVRVVSGLLSIPANSVAASAIRLFEDTDNGTNSVDIRAATAITSNRTLTLPDNTGTLLSSASGFLFNNIVYETTGTAATYTTPTGVRALYVECVGGGGGSGGVDGQGAATGAVSGPGAGGGYTAKLITTPSATYTYTIGSGGAGGASGDNNGTTGGTTTFTDGTLTLTATGGTFGDGAEGTAGGARILGNAGGTGSGGDINIEGQSGAMATVVGGDIVSMGNSGFCPIFGCGIVGRVSVSIGSAGPNGVNHGDGGGSAYAENISTNFAGGDGEAGVIRITEYF